MSRHARLGLAEDGDQFAHGEFSDFQEAEDAQPRFLAGRLEAREQSPERKGMGSWVFRHKHIFISILMGVKRSAGNANALIVLSPARRLLFEGETKMVVTI